MMRADGGRENPQWVPIIGNEKDVSYMPYMLSINIINKYERIITRSVK